MDLWPLDITAVKARAPIVVLREQASFLGQRTQNIVEAEVMPTTSDSTSFRYVFIIVAPALGEYRFKLFEAWYDVELYPVRISLDGDIAAEKIPGLFIEGYVVKAGDEEDLIRILGCIFGAKKTRQVITALLAQSEAKTA